MHIGAVVLGAFALAWALAGTASVRVRWRVTVATVAAAITSFILWRGLHFSPPVHNGTLGFDGKWFALATGLETVGIPLAAIGLRRLDNSHYILPAVALIVGIHFLVLVPAFHYPFYGWAGALIIAVAVVPVIALPPHTASPTTGKPIRLWDMVVGGGVAAVLWYTAFRLLGLA